MPDGFLSEREQPQVIRPFMSPHFVDRQVNKLGAKRKFQGAVTGDNNGTSKAHERHGAGLLTIF
jgi:hypothetical protein